ncbi:hypothetical protein [Flavobacterium sp. HNIBRBA15423]|uniref:hypothetical protein n=1 Tax=Flavobacterium sp. HNIBRBA15423 TaxID=3458683 RepID=UPI0040439DD0
MKTSLKAVILLFITLFSCSKEDETKVTPTPELPTIVTIPDANFKASLLAHGNSITGNGISKIDTNDDGEIQISEAQVYAGTINCFDKNISDLTGIEAFINITGLGVVNNQLASLNISQNTALEVFNCGGNQLTSLDVSQNTVLKFLYCYENQLTSLDVSQNIALTQLNCQSNQLTNLDVSQNVALTLLACLSNQLTSLDVSQNVALIQLHCYDNQLISLNLANGNNDELIVMKASNNNSPCIKIDSGFTPPSSWEKDATASYSTSCL